MAYGGNLESLPNSLLGGNIITILARQAIRLNAMRAASRFQAKRAELENMTPAYTPPAVFVAGIPVSTRTQEAYSYSADVSQHSVESGAVLSDHVILHPIRVDLSFEITNWEPGFAEYASQLLDDLYHQRTPVDLITEHKRLESMVITSLQSDNSLPAWGALSFRVSFAQVKFLTIESVKFPADRVEKTPKTSGPPVKHQAAAEKDGGKIVPKESGIIALKRGLFSQ